MKKSPPVSEGELIVALQTRSRKAYGMLYDQYAPALLGIICKIVHNSDKAENLLQDTFVEIWTHFDRYDASKGRLFTWMLNIARTRAIDFLHSQQKTDAIQMLDGGKVIKLNSMTKAIQADHTAASDTLSPLDPKLRQVIDMIYFEGCTQQEVASALTIPLGTVKTQTQLAMQQLKNLFRNTN